jgi:small subunit ribosomal protein S4
MGDPKKTRKKYSPPSHPWQKERIEEETELNNKYAFKNKKEIWKMNSKLKGYKQQAKKLSSETSKQAEKEKALLLKKLNSLGLLKEGDNLDSILVLKLGDLMERRLQSMVFKKGLARTMKQARQFITHGHIEIKNNVVTSPSYLVRTIEENGIKFKSNTALAKADHPERAIKVKEVKNEKKETEKSKEKSE